MQVYVMNSGVNSTFDHIQTFLGQVGHTITTRFEQNELFNDWKQAEDHVLASDAVVGEGSGLTEASMFELYLALKHDKPTLFFYQKSDVKNALVQQVLDIDHKKLVRIEFKDKEDLARKMLDFINEVKDKLDAKLFMIIPPSVNKYLEWVSNNTPNSKSDVVRAAIERSAQEDQGYQSFLESIKNNP